MTRRALLAGLLLLLVFGAAPARANGRFPDPVTVTFRPGDPAAIYQGATFGLLFSPDDGDHIWWIGEDTIGFRGVYDPVYAVSAPGTIFATLTDGLSLSRDGGCSFTKPPELPLKTFGDVQVAADGAIWASEKAGMTVNDVYVSRDDGAHFTATGLLHPLASWGTVRIAPTDPMRVYVAGYALPGNATDNPFALFQRSDDGGGSWTDMMFPEGPYDLRLLGVSRADPDLVFAHLVEVNSDELYLSRDGGVTWTGVLAFDGAISGFLPFADGQTFEVGTRYWGVQVTHDAGMTWAAAKTSPNMACAGIRADDERAFTCGSNWEPDYFALGSSTDGEVWTKVWRFQEVDGPLDCPAGTPQHDISAPLWPQICSGPIMACPGPDAGPPPGPDPGGKGGCGCGVALGCLLVFPLLLGSRKK